MISENQVKKDDLSILTKKVIEQSKKIEELLKANGSKKLLKTA